MFDSKTYQQTWADLKQLASIKFDLFKVDVLEKAAKIIGLILFALVLILLLFAIVSFGCLALIFALGESLPMWAATLIVVALWLLIMAGAITFRTQLFIHPMLAAISAILFAPSDKSPAGINQQPAVSNQPDVTTSPQTTCSGVKEREEVRHE